MKFEKINGVQYIVLEKNDKIYITTPDDLEKKQVKIENNDEKLDISGNSSIVNSIRGEGMLEKVYIPPVITSEEIIDKCDKWLNMFKQVHDEFKKLVLTEKYRNQHVIMDLSFSTFFSLTDSSIKGNVITLDLKRYGTIIKDGVSISIDETNEDVYSYLVANVLNYYVSQNYENEKINLEDFNGFLSCSRKYKNTSPTPMIASLGSLTEPSECSKIVASILGSHNLGESSEQLIANLKNRISNQQISDSIDSDINHSSIQCEHILKKTLDSKK